MSEDMSIVLEEREGTRRLEVFAPKITIHANSEDTLAGSILTDLATLTYFDGVLTHSVPEPSAGESIGEFIGREFDIGGKVITGIELMLAAKVYVQQLHAEREAARQQPVEPDPEPEPEAP